MSRAARFTCCCRGLISHRDALGEGGDAPELGAHPGRVDDGLGLAAGHERTPEDEVIGLKRRGGRSGAEGSARYGLGLARQSGHVHLDGTVDQACVGREPVALGEQDEVPGHEGRRLHLHCPSRATDAGTGRQVTLEGLGGLLGLQFLDEGEDGVQDYDRDDGDRERDRPCDDGSAAAAQRRSARGWVNWRANSRSLLLPSRRLISFGPCCSRRRAASLLGEALPTGSEMPEEQIQPLLRIHARALWGFGVLAHAL